MTIDGLKRLTRKLIRRDHVRDQQQRRPDSRLAGQSSIMDQYQPPPGPPPRMATSLTTDAGVPGLAANELDYLVNEVKDYQLMHGSLVKQMRCDPHLGDGGWVRVDPNSVRAVPVGVSVLPTPFPKRCFIEALQLQEAFNELYMRVACDEAWLYGVLEPLLEGDDFLAALWDIHLKVKEIGEVQDIVSGMFRSDYMLDSGRDGVSLKQVEMNNLSVAGACHAESVAGMHAHLQRVRDGSNDLPPNNNTDRLATSLALGHGAYTSNKAAPKLCVLMVVQPNNVNIADERPLEYALWDRGIPLYRCEWQAVLQQTRLTEDRTLLFKPMLSGPELEVSVVYYRAGYMAEEYSFNAGFETRLSLEMSRAIRCPDVLTHLTTFKVVQQALTRPGAVERFLSSEKAAIVRETFMPIYDLFGEEGRIIGRDIEKAKDYVLKPNLEGGGHNIYRRDIPAFLLLMPEDRWKDYILMRLIEPPEDTIGILMPPGGLYQGPLVSELGVLGTCLWRVKRYAHSVKIEVLSNECAGWTFKSKPRSVDEMSVLKGFGCFDCPSLQV